MKANNETLYGSYFIFQNALELLFQLSSDSWQRVAINFRKILITATNTSINLMPFSGNSLFCGLICVLWNFDPKSFHWKTIYVYILYFIATKEMREWEVLKKLAVRGKARKFYEMSWRLAESFKTGANCCRT